MDPFFNNGSISSGWRSSLHGQLPRIHSRQIVAAMWRAGTTVQFSAISPSTRRLEDARAALKQSESCQKIQDRTYPFTDVDPFGFSILQHSICSRVPGGRCPSAVASGTAALALERPTCRTLVPVAAPAAKPPEIVGQNAVWRSSAFGWSKSTLASQWSPEIGRGSIKSKSFQSRQAFADTSVSPHSPRRAI